MPDMPAGMLASMTSDEDTAIRLLEEALHLRRNGERAPGGNETWADWTRRSERFLRERLTRLYPEAGE
jgi:hypothetical protein